MNPAAQPPINPEQLQQALAQLHDISQPADPSWWPLAPGWWALMGLAIVVLIGLFVCRWWWRKTALRRMTKRHLADLEVQQAEMSDQAFLKAAAQTLRRICLDSDPQASTLTGDAWAGYLNDRGRTNFFTTQAGEQLLQARFAKQVSVDRERQLNALRAWAKEALS